MARLTFTVPPEADGRSVGDILRRVVGMSRKGVNHAKFVDDGILLDGVRVRTNVRAAAGQVVSVAIDDAPDAASCNVVAEAGAEVCAAVEILYEDEYLAVVNKPAGMVMYPGPGHAGDTLGNVMLARLTRLAERAAATGEAQGEGAASGEGVVGAQGEGGPVLHPVQRLDGGTSGAVVFAYNPHVQHMLQRALHTPQFVREYVAFTSGVPQPAEGLVRAPIARVSWGPSVFAAVPEDDPRGKAACTHYAVEAVGDVPATADTPDATATSDNIAQVQLRLETGRTHQIRIHMALLGTPLLGDSTYGAGPFAHVGLARPALHSARVVFTHPMTGETVDVSCPLPPDLAAVQALCHNI